MASRRACKTEFGPCDAAVGLFKLAVPRLLYSGALPSMKMRFIFPLPGVISRLVNSGKAIVVRQQLRWIMYCY